MTERFNGPERIVGAVSRDGIITSLSVKMADGSTQEFVPAMSLPAPVEHYIGKHEKLTGGYRYGGTRT